LRGDIIAAMLSVDSCLLGDPPDCGVIEQQRFDRDLQQIQDKIVSPYVGQFMGKNRLSLIR